MEFVIVTGMSGAGKTSVLKFLEDIGFYCVDNLPPLLMPKFAEICYMSAPTIEKVAMGIDIRGGKLFEDLLETLGALKQSRYEFKILFLDASDDVLMTRYKETRRAHPLAKGDRIITGITQERELLEDVKKASTYIIDTSFILTRQLKEKINDIFIDNKSFNSLMITVLSFGFKYGIPNDSDLVFDVRFLPNPFYVPELRALTGNDGPVQNFVMNMNVSKEFMAKLKDIILFLIPNYINEGKNQLVISIGCTGGKHRSVSMANALFNTLQAIGNRVILQ
ncbi:MAG: RNase adapter RapZ, partial [Clostridiales bacterium]|nr:RNase adapter RapZ [Clostridiales bacterium]